MCKNDYLRRFFYRSGYKHSHVEMILWEAVTVSVWAVLSLLFKKDEKIKYMGLG